MTRYLLLLVASLALGVGAVSTVQVNAMADTSSGSITSKSSVNLTPGSGTKPVTPVDPGGSGDKFPGDGKDPGNEGTGSTGKLTLDYVSDLKFQQQGISNGQILTTATNPNAFVQISDRRATGAGWQLQVNPSELVGEKDSSTISSGASIQLGAAEFIASGQNVYAAPQVVATPTQLIPIGSYSKIAQANKFAGVGTWIMRLNYNTSEPTNLIVLGSAVTQQQTYQGTLSWMLTDTPQ